MHNVVHTVTCKLFAAAETLHPYDRSEIDTPLLLHVPTYMTHISILFHPCHSFTYIRAHICSKGYVHMFITTSPPMLTCPAFSSLHVLLDCASCSSCLSFLVSVVSVVLPAEEPWTEMYWFSIYLVLRQVH